MQMGFDFEASKVEDDAAIPIVGKKSAPAAGNSSVPCECGDPGTHLLGLDVFCSKCLIKKLRGQKLLNKTAKQPLILCCAEGFRAFKKGHHRDYRPLGKSYRVQICLECKKLHWVGRWWTGEPKVCSECSFVAFKEVISSHP